RRDRKDSFDKGPTKKTRPERNKDKDDDKETFRIAVGHEHGVQPSNIVGAIANEAGLDSQFIGRIDIHDTHSFVDLPTGMPKDVFKDLKKVWVSGQQLQITRVDDVKPTAGRKAEKRPKKKMKRRPGTAKGRRTAQRGAKKTKT
ncbi:MAG: DbpA RNA binding domain-containing protein, partial [Salinisphaeraceae bacterium]|nr:DbpA RNA binding domain-containing protein [Salinisphaeraceae bacterium]